MSTAIITTSPELAETQTRDERRAAREFDPYHEWLGIAPHEYPITYYRLLGLADFESNPAAINNAADRQLAFLKSVRTGPRGAMAEQLMQEVTKARLLLLAPGERDEYNRALYAEAQIAAERAEHLAEIATAAPPVTYDSASELGSELESDESAPEIIRQPPRAYGHSTYGHSPYRHSPSYRSRRMRFRQRRRTSLFAEASKIMIGGIAGIALGAMALYHFAPDALWHLLGH